MNLEAWVDAQVKAAQERLNRSVGQKVRYAKEDIRKAVTAALAIVYQNDVQRARIWHINRGELHIYYAGEVWR